MLRGRTYRARPVDAGALRLAAEHGNLLLLNAQLEAGPGSVDSEGPGSWTALLLAARFGHGRWRRGCLRPARMWTRGAAMALATRPSRPRGLCTDLATPFCQRPQRTAEWRWCASCSPAQVSTYSAPVQHAHLRPGAPVLSKPAVHADCVPLPPALQARIRRPAPCAGLVALFQASGKGSPAAAGRRLRPAGRRRRVHACFIVGQQHVDLLARHLHFLQPHGDVGAQPVGRICVFSVCMCFLIFCFCCPSAC